MFANPSAIYSGRLSFSLLPLRSKTTRLYPILKAKNQLLHTNTYKLAIAQQPKTSVNMATHKTDTSKYKFNHTMIRVKDPVRSIKFYELLGMKQIKRIDQEEAKFSLYFLGYNSIKADSGTSEEWSDREGLLELTHNYGTEDDANYTTNNGNKDPHKGFGHIAITVDDLEMCCDRLEEAGVKFQKKLTEGRMHNIAFALDPDDYWVEILALPKQMQTATNTTETETYRLNHSMIRVKDPKASLAFYQSTLGMSLLRRSEHENGKFTLYFLAYRRQNDHYDNCAKFDDDEALKENVTSHREGILELTHNWGTESDESFKGYHNGNDQPQGFGHICISVDDLDEACARFEDLGVNWKKKLTDGRMKNVAFLLDPDNYWVEVVQNEKLKSRTEW